MFSDSEYDVIKIAGNICVWDAITSKISLLAV